MKIAKLLLLFILNSSIYSYVLAMEREYLGHENQAINDHHFMILPYELHNIILCQLIQDVYANNGNILKTVGRLRLVSHYFKERIDEIKKSPIWESIIEAIKPALKYVRGKNPKQIVEELLKAAQENNIELVHFLISGRADLLKLEKGFTALILAAKCRETVIVQRLIDADVELDIQNDFGNTALIWSIMPSYVEIARILIAAKADLNIQNKSGYTALIWSIMNNNAEITQMLIAAGANFNIQDNDGNTALRYAVIKDHKKITQKFITDGANLGIQNKFGNTTLIEAYRGIKYKIALMFKSKN